MLSQIKTDDALTNAWWHELQQVQTLPNGVAANPLESIKKAVAHIKATIPDNNIYCIATQTGNQATPHHHWFSTVEGAACFAVHSSLVKHTKGVWYATSAYTNEPEVNRYGNPSRSAKNVVGVKSLWVDLDVAKPIPAEWVDPIRLLNARSDKHEVISQLPADQQEQVREYLKELDKYHSQEEAVQGLVEFIGKTGLKPSRVLSSGRGIHAYWHLTETLTVNTWKQLAEGFKALTIQHGLKADPMRTADPASLMRLPGTWHRKGEPLEVDALVVNEVVYTYDALIATIKEQLRLTNPSVLKNMREKHAPTGAAAALLRPTEFPPANAEIVATKCQQVRFFRQSRGMVDEPTWYLLAGTVGHCVNGEAYFHEWSSGHPDYNYNAAQSKIDQWMERTTGPSSCAAFESKNPTGCASCPFKGKIAFPVQLGEEAAPLIEEFALPPVELAGEDGEVETKRYVPPTQLGSFHRTVNGIQIVDDNLPAPITICDHDIWITRNSHDRQTDSRITNICYRDNHGDLHEYQLKASVLSDQKMLLTWLYDKGLYIKPDHAKNMSSYLQAYINDIAKNQKTISLHSSMGWAVERNIDGREKNVSGFVLGNRLITKNGTVEAGLSPRIRTFSRGYHPEGDRDTWIKATRIFREPGLESRAFTFLAAFGAPLMKFSGFSGAVISLLGDTGVGKTSAAVFGLSVYGDPETAISRKQDTENAKINYMTWAKNLPVCFDEMTHIKSEAISELAYNISAGKPKNKLTSDSSLREVDAEQWHTLTYMTTNASLIQKVKMDKTDPTALMVRILEIDVYHDDRWDRWCESELSEIASGNYGLVGEEYLAYVVKHREEIEASIKAMQNWVKENGSNMGAHRFLNATIACTFVGAQIAKNLGLIDFDLNPVADWAMKAIKDHAIQCLGQKVDPHNVFGTFVAENIGKMVAVKEVNGHVEPASEIPRGVIVARLEVKDQKFYVRKDALERWLSQRQINSGDVVRALMKKGLMLRGIETYNLTKGLYGIPAVRVECYVMDAEALGIQLETPKNESGD